MDDDREEDDFQSELDLDTEAEVECPHCGETVVITLDPAGGTLQEYVEDCEVCCGPWRVRIRYDDSGVAEVTPEPS